MAFPWLINGLYNWPKMACKSPRPGVMGPLPFMAKLTPWLVNGGVPNYWIKSWEVILQVAELPNPSRVFVPRGFWRSFEAGDLSQSHQKSAVCLVGDFLGGGFKYVSISPRLGEMIQFD